MDLLSKCIMFSNLDKNISFSSDMFNIINYLEPIAPPCSPTKGSGMSLFNHTSQATPLYPPWQLSGGLLDVWGDGPKSIDARSGWWVTPACQHTDAPTLLATVHLGPAWAVPTAGATERQLKFCSEQMGTLQHLCGLLDQFQTLTQSGECLCTHLYLGALMLPLIMKAKYQEYILAVPH